MSYEDAKKKLKTNLKSGALMLGLTGTIIATSFTSCNKKLYDDTKTYNVVMEKNNDILSVVGIRDYLYHTKNLVQFDTQDNLIVLTDISNCQFYNFENKESLYNYSLLSTNTEIENIANYNELQGIDYNFNNRNIKKLPCLYFNKAIIDNGDNLLVVDIDSWVLDGKRIKLEFSDNEYMFTDTSCVKLINDTNADEDSLKNYLLTLVDDEKDIVYACNKNIKKIVD